MNAAMYDLLGNAQKKMNSSVMLMKYRFSHFCTKADPVTLLEVQVVVDGEKTNLEEVADVSLDGDYVFNVIPKDKLVLYDICKAIATAHPEFKLERKQTATLFSDEDMEQLKAMLAEKQEDKGQVVDMSFMDDEMFVACTIPPVNEDRHDAGLDFTKGLFETTKAYIEKTCTNISARLIRAAGTKDPEGLEKATQDVKDMRDEYTKIAEEFRSQKDDEIEAAYQHYLEEEAKRQSMLQEESEAHGTDILGMVNLNE